MSYDRKQQKHIFTHELLRSISTIERYNVPTDIAVVN